jgi:hypothetical protein
MRRDPRSSGGLGLSPPGPRRSSGGRGLSPPGPRRSSVAAIGLGLALVLAACGGSPDGDRVASLSGGGATGTTSGAAKDAAKDPQQAALDFARCMRQHGIDMPDPQVDDQGRIRVRVGPGGPGGGSRPDPEKLEAAQQACGGLLGGGDGDRQLDPADRDAMVAFARCMREHGIDMPDPTGDGLLLRRGGDDGPDPESAEFQEAEKACGHHLADLRRGRREAGGGS